MKNLALLTLAALFTTSSLVTAEEVSTKKTESPVDQMQDLERQFRDFKKREGSIGPVEAKKHGTELVRSYLKFISETKSSDFSPDQREALINSINASGLLSDDSRILSDSQKDIVSEFTKSWEEGKASSGGYLGGAIDESGGVIDRSNSSGAGSTLQAGK